MKVDGESSAISEYTFGECLIRHQFCKHCGCAPFGGGIGPDGNEMVAVNLNCTHDMALDSVEIIDYDGASQ